MRLPKILVLTSSLPPWQGKSAAAATPAQVQTKHAQQQSSVFPRQTACAETEKKKGKKRVLYFCLSQLAPLCAPTNSIEQAVDVRVRAPSHTVPFSVPPPLPARVSNNVW